MIWLWLTKRPENMAKFAEQTGGLPDNFCAMTSVTSDSTLSRVDALRDVKCKVRGLSIEPLWSPIPDQLDLTDIDWVIVGGESGARAVAKPFRVEWAEEIHELCKRQGVAYFCKQLGRNPTRNGKPINLSAPHGDDWSAWESQLRIREFPNYFRTYCQ